VALFLRNIDDDVMYSAHLRSFENTVYTILIDTLLTY